MRLDGSSCLVTGGASGLGAATVRLLHDGGACVVIADLHDVAGQALAEALGDRALYVHTDVASEAQGRACVERACARFGGLQVLVNCAGIAHGERIVGREGAHRLETFARTIEVNLVGTFNMMRLGAEAMVRGAATDSGERGVVINTASIAAWEGQIGQAAYAASKAGIAGLTLPAARELARSGIRVVTIAPGLFHTPLMDAMAPEVRDALGASVPYPPRLGRPEEFAAMVRHVIENEMLNGTSIRLDGALRMAPR